VIATSRIVDPVEADSLIASGAADAVGMTRALITDPEMPAKARSGRAADVLRCIGCNACIAHYHAGTPIRCAQNPRTGRELTLAATERSSEPRRVVVVGAGPAGLAAAAEAGAAGHEVILLERGEAIGGQVGIAAAAPAHVEQAAALRANYETLLDRANVELRLGVEVDAALITELAADVAIIATGARPAPNRHVLQGLNVAHVWDVLGGARPPGERVVIADWGGDPAGLDCAEVLAREGRRVTLAVGAVLAGETIHQYQRNNYLARLYRAGVRIEHHLGLESATGGRVSFRNIFAVEQSRELEADLLLLSLGRVPVDELASELIESGSVRVEVVGDCLSPRGLEEAILEGTLAARRVEAGAGATVGAL
jgi:NADPH-dependent 2,4-dienoyl-CoA reductase/sulfur reductase-like enzyme